MPKREIERVRVLLPSSHISRPHLEPRPCEGGRPRGRPGLARTPLTSEEPLRGAGGWENSLLAVADLDEEL